MELEAGLLTRCIMGFLPRKSSALLYCSITVNGSVPQTVQSWRSLLFALQSRFSHVKYILHLRLLHNLLLWNRWRRSACSNHDKEDWFGKHNKRQNMSLLQFAAFGFPGNGLCFALHQGPEMPDGEESCMYHKWTVGSKTGNCIFGSFGFAQPQTDTNFESQLEFFEALLSLQFGVLFHATGVCWFRTYRHFTHPLNAWNGSPFSKVHHTDT